MLPEQQPRSREKFDYLMFTLAIAILFVILGLGWAKDGLQYNILYLMCLSLGCAIVFAYLPFFAELNVEWFRAGGAAAIFAVCMWQTLPFAKDIVKSNYDTKLKTSADTISSLNTSLSSKENEIIQLRDYVQSSVNRNSECATANSSTRKLLEDASIAGTAARAALERGQTLAAAAQSNYSDSKTCSLRASQTLEHLAQLKVNLDSSLSSLASASASTK